MFGKWHLGSQPEYHPSRRGFDQAVVTSRGHFGFKTTPEVQHRDDEYLADFRAATNWEYESLHNVLTEFLNSEDPKQRRRHQLINLHFFAGMTYKAAASELGISTSQCQIDRARALAELQQAISTREM